MRKTILALALGSLISTTSAIEVYDNTEVYGSVEATTDYVFRGVSQNNEDISVLTTVGIEHKGFYVEGFVAPVEADGSNYKFDTTAGYTDNVDDFTYNMGVVGYWYPGSNNDLDFYEFFGGLSYDFDVVNVGGDFNYSPDYYGNVGNNTYWHGYVEADPFWDITWTLGAGYNDLLDADNVDGITDWEFSAEKKFMDDSFGVKLAYYDTDLSVSDFELDNIFSERAVLSGTVYFK